MIWLEWYICGTSRSHGLSNWSEVMGISGAKCPEWYAQEFRPFRPFIRLALLKIENNTCKKKYRLAACFRLLGISPFTSHFWRLSSFFLALFILMLALIAQILDCLHFQLFFIFKLFLFLWAFPFLRTYQFLCIICYYLLVLFWWRLPLKLL